MSSRVNSGSSSSFSPIRGSAGVSSLPCSEGVDQSSVTLIGSEICELVGEDCWTVLLVFVSARDFAVSDVSGFELWDGICPTHNSVTHKTATHMTSEYFFKNCRLFIECLWGT